MGDSLCISVWHLTSHEHMGTVRSRCLEGCSCTVQTINSHYIESFHGRNASVYKEHRVQARVSAAARDCILELRIDEHTTSGGHKFRARDVTLRRGALLSSAGQNGYTQCASA